MKHNVKYKSIKMSSYLHRKMKQEEYNIFIPLCKNSSIETDNKKFYYFCNRASYFYVRGDNRFYEYAPLELCHRRSYSIKEMYDKFQAWNNGKKHFICWNRKFPEYPESIEAKNSNQAKYRYSRSNSIAYIQTGSKVAYQNCL